MKQIKGPVPLLARFKFKDGTFGELPLTAWADAELRFVEWLQRSDNPDLQKRGDIERDRLLTRLTQASRSFEQRRKAARKPRPSRRSPITERVVDVMRRARSSDLPFKEFLSGWLSDPCEGLRITEREVADDKPRYSVDDENDASEPSEYTLTTLQKTLWSAAAKKKP